jgi:hypothetical protein
LIWISAWFYDLNNLKKKVNYFILFILYWYILLNIQLLFKKHIQLIKQIADFNKTGFTTLSVKQYNITLWTRVERSRVRSQSRLKDEELIIGARRFCLGIKVNFSLLWTTRESFLFSFVVTVLLYYTTRLGYRPWVFKI